MEVDQNVSDVPNDKSGAESKGNGDTVAYDTYRRVLGEKKKRDSELLELKDKLANLSESLNGYKQKELEQDGKQSELIQSLREQLAKRETELKETSKKYAWNTISSQIKSAATKEGCINADKLINLIDPSDLRAIEVDEHFNVNSDDLKTVLERARQENDFMFPKRAVVNDMVPASDRRIDVNTDKKVEELTKDEIINQLKSL